MKMVLMEQLKMQAKEKKGFTLVEVIVVLVILAILMAIAIPSLTGYIDKAAEKKAIAEARIIVTALQTIAVESYGTGAVIYGTANSERTIRVSGGYQSGVDQYSKLTYRETINQLTGKNYTAANFGNTGGGTNTLKFDTSPTGTATVTGITYVTDDGKMKVVYAKDLKTGDMKYTVTKQ